jgi:hypothetical protein
VPDSVITCKSCVKGKVSLGGSAYCTNCVAGQYQPNTRKAVCQLCKAGKFQSQKGATECEPCKAGFSSTESAALCDKCTAGTFTATPGTSSCAACEHGKFQKDEGGTECVEHSKCPAGKYRKIIGSSTLHEGECVTCATHTYKIGKGHWFSPCNTCKACEPGTFRSGCGPQAGGECKPCGNGTFKRAGTEGTSTDQCLPCTKGLFQSGTGASKCDNCISGTYSDDIGAKLCKSCKAGRFGNDKMAPLEAGEPIKASASYCHQCEFGQYQTESGKSECSSCLKGRYGNTGILQTSEAHCVACETGTFAAEVASKTCKTCHNYSPTCVYCKWTARQTGAETCTDKPVPCEVSNWSDWGACDKSCAVGKQSRTRTVTREALHGGTACPSLTTDRQCNVHNCPVNCLVTEWDAFSRCTEICAGGTAPAGGKKTRKRGIHRAPKFGGAECPALPRRRPATRRPAASARTLNAIPSTVCARAHTTARVCAPRLAVRPQLRQPRISKCSTTTKRQAATAISVSGTRATRRASACVLLQTVTRRSTTTGAPPRLR